MRLTLRLFAYLTGGILNQQGESLETAVSDAWMKTNSRQKRMLTKRSEDEEKDNDFEDEDEDDGDVERGVYKQAFLRKAWTRNLFSRDQMEVGKLFR